jgi:hypothetical protein
MQDEVCPKCKSDSELVGFYSVRLSLHEWPSMLLFAGVVLVYGGFVGAGQKAALCFAALAAAPFFIGLISKRICLKCGIEFCAAQRKS